MIPALIFAASAVILLVSALLLGRNLYRRGRQEAVGDWRIVESIGHELSGLPGAAPLSRDLIHLARAELGFPLQPVRLRELLQAAVRRAAERGVQVQVHEGGDPHVAADAEALGHALDIALRHAAAGSRVLLTTDGARAEVILQMAFESRQDVAVLRRIVQAHRADFTSTETEVRLSFPLR